MTTFFRSGGYQEVFIDMANGPVVVDADRRRVDQVLNYPLGNAGKFSRQDSPVTKKVDTNWDSCTVQIIDQGRGSRRMCCLTSSASSSRREKARGATREEMGWAWAICKGTVETHGFDLMDRIREVSGMPIVILTARDDPEDTVRALRLGADDYITKPFSPSELLARIEACLRRRVLPDEVEARPAFALEDWGIKYVARQVSVAGEAIYLTATEYKLLYELSVNAGRVLTNDQILRRVWGPEYTSERQLVRAIVRNLRRKLGDDARNPRFIFTVPQVGYRMAGPATH